jgi:hypothetical protein
MRRIARYEASLARRESGVYAKSSHSRPHERVLNFALSGSLAHLFFQEVALVFVPYPP